jgi:hypothetical protein
MIKNMYMKHSAIAIFVLFVLLAVIFVFPILSSGKNLGIQDWGHHLGYLESARKTVLEYKQFPLWDPFHCGGMPALGNPQSGFVSITFLFVIIFGTVIGVKISILLHLFIALYGTYLLARYLKFSKKVSVIVSVIFSCSGVMPSAITTGMLPFLYSTYIPLIALFLIKAVKEKEGIFKNIVLSALFLSLVYYGGHQIAMVIIPVIAAYLLIEAVTDKSPRPFIVGVAVGIVFVVICLPKLYLNVLLMQSYPRYIDDYSGFSPAGLAYFLTSPVQNLNYDMFLRRDLDYSFGIDENSLYIGVLGFIFFLVGVIKIKGKYKLLLLFVIILMMGNIVPFSLFELLRELPFYNEFRVAQRFRFPFILIAALLAGKGIEFFETGLKNKKYIIVIGMLIFVDLCVFSTKNFLSNAFIVENNLQKGANPKSEPPLIVEDLNYQYLQKNPTAIQKENYDLFITWGSDFPAAYSDTILFSCIDPVPVMESRVSKNTDFLPNVDPGKIPIIWSPNKITMDISEFGGQNIQVNQNYIYGWNARSGNGDERMVTSVNGLLAVRRLASDKQITLYYNPFIFFKAKK